MLRTEALAKATVLISSEAAVKLGRALFYQLGFSLGHGSVQRENPGGADATLELIFGGKLAGMALGRAIPLP